MASSSAARAGFRAVKRRPALWLAEVAWRWAFGLGALVLLAVAAVEVMDAVVVTSGDELLLRSWAPVLMADAVTRVLHGVWLHLLRALAVLVPSLAVLWTVTCAAGRAATVPPLVRRSERGWRGLLGLGLLRAALALAAVLGYVGAAVIAGKASTSAEQVDPGLFMLVFIPVMALVVLIWALLNWFFSLAPLFVVRDGRDTLGSIADSVQLFRRRSREMLAVSTVFGTLRLIAIIAAFVLSLIAVAAAQKSPAAAIALLVVITLAYFMLADFLYISRLAAYAEILEDERGGATTAAAPALPLQPVEVAGVPAPGGL